MPESESGSGKQTVVFSTSGTSDAPKIDLEDWISQKARAFEKRISESSNYSTAFLMDPIQTLAREGLLEGATEFSMTIKKGSLAKMAWAQDLYRRDPIGVIAAAPDGGGGGLTFAVEVVVCIRIFGRAWCFGVEKHI